MNKRQYWNRFAQRTAAGVVVVGTALASSSALADGAPTCPVDWSTLTPVVTSGNTAAIAVGVILFGGILVIKYGKRILRAFGIG